jgi:hypothetical protein
VLSLSLLSRLTLSLLLYENATPYFCYSARRRR